jgi:CheY-like chemotaxis protein
VQQTSLVVVLVVEDEALIQAMMGDALSEGGFKAKIVASGEEALQLLESGDKDTYRAVITDINLAGELNGWDVARRAREIYPEIPIIYMTGAAADQWPSHGVPHSILLNKPFAPAQIVTAVATLLNQTPPLAPHE